ncbi:MAG: glycosyltransferase AglD [Candidatus Micrarchaeota archaeon]|nr:MAG: glycosyltransferase AglD [Candidatus Micrarchaeota archaeon]
MNDIDLTIILPVKNQEENIRKNMNSIIDYAKRRDIKLIAVENDSRDRSLKLLEEYRNANVEVLDLITYKNGKGKGEAIKRGILAATTKYAAFMDIDLSVPLSYSDDAIALLDRYDIIIGDRYSNRATRRKLNRLVESKVYNGIVRALFNTEIDDHQCGFKFFNREKIAKLIRYVKDDRWFFDTELLVLARRLDLSIYQLPVSYSDTSSSTLSSFDMVYFLKSIIEFKIRLGKTLCDIRSNV